MKQAPLKHTKILTALRSVLAILMLLIFASAVMVVEQVHQHHKLSSELRHKSLDFDNLKVANQSLLIEQQAFSAIPQVAQRSVSELGMFFPVGENRRILTPVPVTDQGERQGN